MIRGGYNAGIKMKRIMIKKEYQKPSMKVVKLQHQSHILAGSYGAKSVSNSDGISWKTDGFDEGDQDY